MQKSASSSKTTSVESASMDKATIEETQEAFADKVKDLSSNLYSISKDVTEGSTADKKLEGLPTAIGLIENWLLNLNSRPDLLMGYVKRVYVNKRAFDANDGDAIMNDDDYLYGDFELARPYAPMFKRLWSRHMKKNEDEQSDAIDEQTNALEFFRIYNAIVEDWIMAGAKGLFDPKFRSHDFKILQRLQISVEKLLAVPEEKRAQSKELQEHYALLKTIRNECLALRQKTSGTTEKTSAEVSSVTVTKHKDHYDVDAIDVRVEQSDGKTKVSTVKVKTTDKELAAAKKKTVVSATTPTPAAMAASSSSSSSSSSSMVKKTMTKETKDKAVKK